MHETETIAWDEGAGFCVIPGVVRHERLDGLRAEAERLFAAHGRRPAGLRGVVRHSPVFAEVAGLAGVRSIVEPVLGAGAVMTRSILFDKTPEANWDVAWHRDTAVAVAEKIEVEGFGPWSVKEGVVHVRPPVAVLREMLTVRVHLDECGMENGALLVAPGSHLEAEDPSGAECEARSTACCVGAGGAVVMRPLIMHASRRARAPSHRRVLHLEFAGEELPGGLRWARV